MKKRDLYLIIGIVIVAAVCWAILMLLQNEHGDQLQISVNQEVYGVYNLNEEQVIAIGDTNICEITNGSAVMLKGECPDQVCVHSKAIKKTGQTIICMPNKVVLEIIGISSEMIDTIAE